ncbi:hypothetical protein FIM09_05040 [SAR202 cluster bacterium AC-647-P02_OGT_505m]|nr:hypothetical protein [SAR202 cluster bacterium AC-647-P02_OGT_505m]
MRYFSAAIKIWATGACAGALTALLFLIAHFFLATDKLITGPELILASSSPGLSSLAITYISARIFTITDEPVSFNLGIFFRLLVVCYLTFLIPLLGVVQGSSQSAYFLQLLGFGLLGGIFWSTPFAAIRFLIEFINRTSD